MLIKKIKQMKRILLFGATGRTGKYALGYALQKGYAVTALVRNPDSILVKSDKLKLVKGSPYNLIDVKEAMQNCDIVISTLNNPRKTDMPWSPQIGPEDVLAKSVSNAIQIMKEIGAKRIITISAFGVGDSFPLAPGLMRFIVKKTNLKIVYADHDNSEKLLSKSGLDWTSVRATGLTSADKIKNLFVNYDTAPSGFPAPTISRKHVAQFMIDIIDNLQYFGKTPIISEK